ncbi:MAG: pyrroloquinoline quinone precursor peptide PqqA [Burkholderiales bacterium]
MIQRRQESRGHDSVPADFSERERSPQLERSFAMKWSKPEFSEMRFGFEVTMYIANR